MGPARQEILFTSQTQWKIIRGVNVWGGVLAISSHSSYKGRPTIRHDTCADELVKIYRMVLCGQAASE